MAEGFNPEGVMKPFGIYSNASWAPSGEMLFISGIVPNDVEGNTVGIGDIGVQTRQVLENIKTILESVGSTMDDIQVMNVFVTDMSGLDKVHEVRSEYFNPPYPASTLVQVTALVNPDYLIEINATAVIPHDRVRRPNDES